MSRYIPRSKINTVRWSRARLVEMLVVLAIGFPIFLGMLLGADDFIFFDMCGIPTIWLLMAIAFLWQAYGINYLEAGDIRMLWRQAPHREWRRVKGNLWAPPVILTAVSLGCLISVLVVTIGSDPDRDFAFLAAVGFLVFLLGAAASGYASIILQPKIERRFRRNLRIRRICWRCGYDLHACVTPACPECGEPIPWLTKADPAGEPET